MKITGNMVAEIARSTKKLNPEGLGETMHFYTDGSAVTCYEDVSGQESYPGETGEFLLSVHWPLSRREVAEELSARGFGVPGSLL